LLSAASYSKLETQSTCLCVAFSAKAVEIRNKQVKEVTRKAGGRIPGYQDIRRSGKKKNRIPT